MENRVQLSDPYSTSGPDEMATAVTIKPGPSLGGLITIFAASNIVSMFLRLTGGFFIARFSDPADLGLFNSMALVLIYAPILLIGIPSGLSRELPLFIGKGEPSKARSLASTAQSWSLILSAILGTAMLGLSVYYGSRQDWMMAAGWLTQAFFILVVIYGQYYLEITFRTLNDFTHISIINVVQQSVGLLSVPIIWFAGFLGLCARSVLMGTIYLWLLWRWRPLRVIPRWNFPNFRHLFRIGIPIFVVGQLDTWWIALNPALILILLGTKSVGIYQPALLTNTAITLLINSVAQVTYPRMVEAYGGGAKLATVLRIPKKSVLYSILLSIPVVVLGWLLMPEIVNFLLPRYSEGILAVQWSLLAALTLSPKPMLNAFNVIKRQDLLAITTILGIAVNGASLLWMGQNGYTVGQFSLAFILGRLVASGSGLLILNHLARKPSY